MKPGKRRGPYKPRATRKTLAESFMSQVKLMPSGCVEWTGVRDPFGYGRWGSYMSVRVHRVAYEACVGKIPSGWVVDHKCMNKSCVNPEHLEAVTHKENMRRYSAKMSARTHCANGHLWTPENTYYRVGHTTRSCRDCKDIHLQRSREKLAAKKTA